MGLLELFLVGVLSLSGVVSSGGSDCSTLGQPVIGEVVGGCSLQSGFWYLFPEETGLDEQTVLPGCSFFRVWPSPAKELVNFGVRVSARVYDASGRLVLEVDGDKWVPVSSGVFFVKVGKEVQKVVVLK